jgi:phosphoribosylanthranilate isomerase
VTDGSSPVAAYNRAASIGAAAAAPRAHAAVTTHTPPVIKICCISSLEEARLAIEAGASALGLVSAMPSGPGVIDEVLIERIAASVQRPVDTFLLTCLQHADAIAAQHRRCRTTTLQLVDAVPLAELQQLRELLPDVRLVQVIHVFGAASLGEAIAAAPWVDAVLLDSGNPAAAVKELGGTGRTHDWQWSRRIREAIDVPTYLAGGLHAGNVAAAVRQVRPYGLDICSGVRRDGRLDAQRLHDFVRAARGAAAEPTH